MKETHFLEQKAESNLFFAKPNNKYNKISQKKQKKKQLQPPIDAISYFSNQRGSS